MLAPLGAGGMAEVYRARDSRLGREIALKVVNEVLSGDSELVRRFEQEARLAGSLNHPNLVSVYDFGEHEGTPYFVTELLEGESLRHRLARGRPRLGTALDWASQMAAGLAAAHARGVIHRDVKPDNVFLTADGKVKLLDFGIAKLTAAVVAPVGHHDLMEDTVTPTGGATATGAVLGTPGYMSPEQVRGEPLDARTDIFSLGAVLYEMLCGHRAFPGATPVESGYGILHADPEPLPPDVPPAVAQVVQHCLQKEPARRFQSASDLAFALEVLRTPMGSASQPPLEPRRRRRPARWIVGALAAGALVVAGAFAAGMHARPAPGTSSLLPGMEPVTFRLGTIHGARFLPDGRVVFSAAFEGLPEEVFIRPSGSPIAQPLGLPSVRLLAASSTGELAVLTRQSEPFGQFPRGTLARVPSVGGVPRELTENSKFADWSPRGELVVARAVGGKEVLESPPGRTLFRTEGGISHPRFSPSGDRIAFLHHPQAEDTMAEVLVVDLEGRTRTLSRRWPVLTGLAWTPDGGELWFSGGTNRPDTLSAVSLADGRSREFHRSLSELKLHDIAPDGRVLISTQLARVEIVSSSGTGERETVLSWTDWNDPLAEISADGKVLFSTSQTTAEAEGSQPVWVVLRALDGSPAQILGDGFALDLSPDGRWALALRCPARCTELTALPTGAGQPRAIPLHGMEMVLRAARWTGDGRALLGIARDPAKGPAHLYRLAEDGSPPARVSDVPLSPFGYLQLSPDGRWAAALDDQHRVVVISLERGTTEVLPRQSKDPVPRGWSPRGGLWITEAAPTAGGRTRLLRVEPRTGAVLEERSVGPADPAGAGPLQDVVLSRNEKTVAFEFARNLDTLFIVRGLRP